MTTEGWQCVVSFETLTRCSVSGMEHLKETNGVHSVPISCQYLEMGEEDTRRGRGEERVFRGHLMEW